MRTSRILSQAAAALIVLGVLTAPAEAKPQNTAPADGVVSWSSEPSDSALASRASNDVPHEQFYFVLPDRFANGDKSNDKGGYAGDRLSTGYDPTDKGFYHGGDLQGVIDKLDYIQGLGTTAIWLAPVFKNKPVQGSGADASAGYHGYWITDFTQVDPHFGTNADLKRLVGKAHQRGMKIYLDVIVNHTADVLQYAENKYDYVDKKTTPYVDAAGHSFDDANYADGTQGFPKVDVNSGPYTPVFPTAADKTAKKPAWLNDPTMYHNRGNSTFAGESDTDGDFYGLDDLWTERPEVVAGMTKVYQDWIGSAGVDGFRIDTAKSVDMQFWPQFTRGITTYAAAHGKPNFFMFGEVYTSDATKTSAYVRQGKLPATLDFPFQAAAQSFVTNGNAQALSDMYASDALYASGNTDANALPTFLGNHDMGRVGGFIEKSGVDASTYLDRDKLAHELMFLTRGQPVVYSGDEQGFTGPGGDKDARQDMFASLVADYLDDDLIGTDRTHAVDNYDPNHPLYRTIAALGALRAQEPGLATGTQTTRYSGDGVFAFSRIDAAQRTEYVVAANSSTTAKTVTIQTSSHGAFAQLYPTAGSGPDTDADGKITVTVPALSTVVYKAAAPIAPAAGTPTITITSPGDGAAVATQAKVSATLGGADPAATVTFAAQVGGGRWQLLGTARQPDADGRYSVYQDLDGIGGKVPIRYKAVVSSGGHLASDESQISVATPVQGAQREYVLVHYRRTDGNYAGWGVYNWGDSDPSSQHDWPTGQPFAGEDSYGRFAWVKVKPGAANVGFLVVDSHGTKDVETDRSVDPGKTGEIWLKQGDPAIYSSPAAALGHQTIHYHRADGDYSGWGLHLWGDAVASGTDWGTPMPPTGTDGFGAYWDVALKDAAKPVNFIIHKGDTKDPGPDGSVDPTQAADAFVTSGDTTVYASEAAASHVAVLHYRRTGGDYSGWGLHLWDGAATGTDWGSPMPPTGTDAYGAYWRVPLAAGATALSYIVHNGDGKDLPDDQRLDLAKNGNEVWLQQSTPGYLRPLVKSAPHDIDLNHAYAQWIDRGTIVWNKADNDGKVYALAVAPAGGLSIVDGKLSGDFTSVPLTARPDGLTEKQRQAYPQLWNYGGFAVGATDVKADLRAQLVVTESDHLGNLLSATSVQTPGVLDDVYDASHVRLGPAIGPVKAGVAVWAPTARGVQLELMAAPDAAPTLVPMQRNDTTGVWTATGTRAWKGMYYRFRVDVWQPAAGRFVTASVTDPYSLDLSANSTASRLVDLNDAGSKPAGWDRLRKPTLTGRPQIQEASVRDFSIADQTVPAAERGTYLAFTEPSSAGMTELKSLASAGVTHLHLLPTFDFSSTPEKRADQAQPACDLPSLPRDSDRQQACVAAVQNTDGYNWGYDPLHYTVPEGSYAVDPADRVEEYRRMVAGINGAGLRVVADVVYNHTSAAGTDPNSVLDQIVPGYYQRLLDDGTVATSTCCANTAPEHAMMGKLVVDSVVTWAKAYKVDGFRFDLMGHHPKANILAVRAALDDLTPAKDGVDGKSIILYGEGWDFGEVAGNARFVQATQKNMAGTGIATFSDRQRDAVRGGGPFDGDPRIQGFASGQYTDPNGGPASSLSALGHNTDLVELGLAGNLASYSFRGSDGAVHSGSQVDYNGSPAGYAARPGEAVTYVDAHDNEILFDALAYKLPDGTSATDRARMQVLALSTVAFSQGTGFVTLGSSRLRSKSLDKNSFNAGDWFNEIRWDCASGNGFGAGLPMAADNQSRWAYARPLLADPAIVPSCADIAMADARFAELMRIRSSSPVFSLTTAAQVQQRVSFPLSGTASAVPGVITMVLDGTGLGGAHRQYVVVFNGSPSAVTQQVGLSGLSLDPILASSADPVLRTATASTSGSLSVPARSVAVFVR
ncbi:pullulanase-type alpha-1,6-glucosidase [Hamadaea tsunoensis]|uniref:pullulanase-type alpha-1,6-glucosidase n=1 Tax=Hamadaea tsunoensis TaxID=53368 RepID=UPI0007E8E8CE|nr:pullulanase-type alpha-1,6-glucosidase [Hamadaea tsunoensis]